VLAGVFQRDGSLECRETAIRGLACSGAEEAAALVKAAFSSPEERLRAAVLSSPAGDRVLDEMAGGGAVPYLAGEFRSARTPVYRKALIGKLLDRAPGVLAEEIRRLLPAEEDWSVRKSYREILEDIENSRASR
jgi:hypothetical protein